MLKKSNPSHSKRKPPLRQVPESVQKKFSAHRAESDGLMSEFLNQITHAAYLVALKTGFRGSFINFLTELQDALGTVIRQDRAHAGHPR